MYKEDSKYEKRQRDVYKKVEECVRNGDKKLAGIIEFSQEHYISQRTCWRDLSKAVKKYGEIIY